MRTDDIAHPAAGAGAVSGGGRGRSSSRACCSARGPSATTHGRATRRGCSAACACRCCTARGRCWARDRLPGDVARAAHAARVAAACRRCAAHADCTPVLVVPGYTENAGTMWPLGWRLARAGFNPILIDFPSTLHRIESNAEFLARASREVRAVDGRRAGRGRRAQHGRADHAHADPQPRRARRDRVRRDRVAVPRHAPGAARRAAAARALPARRCARAASSCSASRRRLPRKVPTLSMIACQENIVSPEWSAVVAGAETRVLSQPWGHQAPLFMTEVYVQVERWLLAHGVTRHGGAPPRSAGANSPAARPVSRAGRARASSASPGSACNTIIGERSSPPMRSGCRIARIGAYSGSVICVVKLRGKLRVVGHDPAQHDVDDDQQLERGKNDVEDGEIMG